MYLSINEFKARDFCGSNALWNYVVVNAPMEVLHNPSRPIRIIMPKSQRKKGEKTTIFTT
jgi:hypothetical protein